MVDLTSLQKYIVDDANIYIKTANAVINRRGFDAWFNNQLSHFLDCSNTLSNGHRAIQSNSTHYKYEITTILYMIEKNGGNNKDYYYELLLLQHKANLEFEEVNGIEYKAKETPKKKTTRTRNKQTFLFDEPKKETTAEHKLKKHIAKINLLTFNIKPVKNDNTV